MYKITIEKLKKDDRGYYSRDFEVLEYTVANLNIESIVTAILNESTPVSNQSYEVQGEVSIIG